jgi:hypothetical protein
MSHASSYEPVEGAGEEQSRSPYHAPELTQLGTIAELTQTGGVPNPDQDGEGWATS